MSATSNMSEKITLSKGALPASYPSLCIPRVFPNITWQRVKEVFSELNLGRIERVDMVRKENEKGEKFQRVFIHFKFWDRSSEAQAVREKILSGDMIQIVYDDPWFWKVGMSRVTKPERSERVDRRKPQGKGRVRIEGQQSGSRRESSGRGRPQHKKGGSVSRSHESSEISELKEMVAAQAQQMAMMQQMLMGGVAMGGVQAPPSPPMEPHSPPYPCPTTPPYACPTSPALETAAVETSEPEALTLSAAPGAPLKKKRVVKRNKMTPKKLSLRDDSDDDTAATPTPEE
jgi:hypothetical protein